MATKVIEVTCKQCSKKVTALRQGRARVSAYCAECDKSRKQEQGRNRNARYRARQGSLTYSDGYVPTDPSFADLSDDLRWHANFDPRGLVWRIIELVHLGYAEVQSVAMYGDGRAVVALKYQHRVVYWELGSYYPVEHSVYELLLILAKKSYVYHQ